MIKVKKTLEDKEVFELLEQIKEQLSVKWFFIHFDVFDATQETNCFISYTDLKQLNGDGSTTNIIQASFKNNEERWNVFIENCKLGDYSYYLVHSIDILENEVVKETIKPVSEPQVIELIKIE